MARQFQRNRFPVRRSTRPGGGWSRSANISGTASGSGKVLMTSFALSNPDINETIRRIVGHYHHFSDQVAATETYSGAWGIIVANDLAVAAGAGSIPGPVTDANDNGWLYWTGINGSFVFQSGVGFEDAPASPWPYETRAMRKIVEGYQLCFMMQSSTAAGWSLNLSTSLYATRTQG